MGPEAAPMVRLTSEVFVRILNKESSALQPGPGVTSAGSSLILQATLAYD
jgi:hypothetical protein